MVFRLILGATLLLNVLAQVPIPKRPVGFVYHSGHADAPIQVDGYFGPMCPDSKDSFPTMLSLADSYGPATLRFRLHLFPLPYHHNAFLAAKGTHIINNWSAGNLTFNWMKAIYDKLETFSNDATSSMSQKAVTEMFADVASTMGMSKGMFLMQMEDATVEEDTRIEWKYTCTRGISYTPAFTLNDVIIQAEPTWGVESWKKVIDPLLNDEILVTGIEDDKHCKIGTKKCEYLPGKIECCTPGENCIPNVGCRC